MASDEVYEAPTGGFGALPTIGEAYKKVLRFAYPATRDIAKEISTKTTGILDQAKERALQLVSRIQDLKWEIEEARRTIVETNEVLHKLLKEDNVSENPLEWFKEEEAKEITEKPTRGDA